VSGDGQPLAVPEDPNEGGWDLSQPLKEMTEELFPFPHGKDDLDCSPEMLEVGQGEENKVERFHSHL
jgi:hypothetical protein